MIRFSYPTHFREEEAALWFFPIFEEHLSRVGQQYTHVPTLCLLASAEYGTFAIPLLAYLAPAFLAHTLLLFLLNTLHFYTPPRRQFFPRCRQRVSAKLPALGFDRLRTPRTVLRCKLLFVG